VKDRLTGWGGGREQCRRKGNFLNREGGEVGPLQKEKGGKGQNHDGRVRRSKGDFISRGGNFAVRQRVFSTGKSCHKLEKSPYRGVRKKNTACEGLADREIPKKTVENKRSGGLIVATLQWGKDDHTKGLQKKLQARSKKPTGVFQKSAAPEKKNVSAPHGKISGAERRRNRGLFQPLPKKEKKVSNRGNVTGGKQVLCSRKDLRGERKCSHPPDLRKINY